MRAFKISTIIISILIFVNPSYAADRIYCRQYSGKYKEFNLTIQFSKNGKMFIEVMEDETGGYFSSPGSYTFIDSKISFYFKGQLRTVYLKSNNIIASPYTFSIDEDLKTEIALQEDKSFADSCK